VRLDLLGRLHVNQGSDHRPRLEPIGDLHRPSSLGEPPPFPSPGAETEGWGDAVLRKDAVGARTGLAGVAVYRGDRTPCLRRASS
jgi:hypothetical protein